MCERENKNKRIPLQKIIISQWKTAEEGKGTKEFLKRHQRTMDKIAIVSLYLSIITLSVK